MTFDESKVKRDDMGRFSENWAARLAEQMTAAMRRGDVSGQYLPVQRGHAGQPEAMRKGFVRVGDHPTRMGAVGGEESYFGSSTHPAAGGVWVDPARPGTSRAPIFRNDFGSAITSLRPAKSRSQQRGEDVNARRREDWSKVPDDRERRLAEEGGKIGRRLEGAPEAAVKEMRRAQRRTRAETGRVAKRRTPRGTLVEGWMDKVNDRIGKGARRG
jgi:hypothetical protein